MLTGTFKCIMLWHENWQRGTICRVRLISPIAWQNRSRWEWAWQDWGADRSATWWVAERCVCVWYVHTHVQFSPYFYILTLAAARWPLIAQYCSELLTKCNVTHIHSLATAFLILLHSNHLYFSLSCCLSTVNILSYTVDVWIIVSFTLHCKVTIMVRLLSTIRHNYCIILMLTKAVGC